MRRVPGPGSGLLCTGASADPSWGQEESRASRQPPGPVTRYPRALMTVLELPDAGVMSGPCRDPLPFT